MRNFPQTVCVMECERLFVAWHLYIFCISDFKFFPSFFSVVVSQLEVWRRKKEIGTKPSLPYSKGSHFRSYNNQLESHFYYTCNGHLNLPEKSSSNWCNNSLQSISFSSWKETLHDKLIVLSVILGRTIYIYAVGSIEAWCSLSSNSFWCYGFFDVNEQWKDFFSSSLRFSKNGSFIWNVDYDTFGSRLKFDTHIKRTRNLFFESSSFQNHFFFYHTTTVVDLVIKLLFTTQCESLMKQT